MRTPARVVVLALVLGVAACSASDSAGPGPSGVPTGVKSNVAGGTIDLSWNAVPGAIGYKVYMAEVGGVTRVNVGSLTGNMTHLQNTASFDHPLGLDPAKKFFFVVTAVRSDSTESAESCEVNAKILTAEATSC